MKLKYIWLIVLGFMLVGCSVDQVNTPDIKVPDVKTSEYKNMTPIQFINSMPLVKVKITKHTKVINEQGEISLKFKVIDKGWFLYDCNSFKDINGKQLKGKEGLCDSWTTFKYGEWWRVTRNAKDRLIYNKLLKKNFTNISKKSEKFCNVHNGTSVPIKYIGYDSNFIIQKIFNLNLNIPLNVCMVDKKPYFAWGTDGEHFIFMTGDYIRNHLNRDINAYYRKKEIIKKENKNKEDFKY